MKLEEQKFLEPKYSQSFFDLIIMLKDKISMDGEDFGNTTLTSMQSQKLMMPITIQVDDYGQNPWDDDL